jgi:sulfur relay (sulfurtransferase) DsrC/TusE family protein
MQSDLFELQKKLVNNINEVARKVPPLDSLTNKIDQVLKPVESCEKKLGTLVHKYEKPAIKGALGEEEVLNILQDGFPTYTINSVAKQGGKADIEIKSTQSRQNYLVEVKDRKAEVPKKEIEKFQKNVKENKVYKVGILFSLRSGISVYASQGRFAVKFEDDQYYIYVPNALNERKDLIVWIVMLADQLAVLNQGLTDRQTEVVTNLLREFQESVETSKNCKQHIKSLKETVKALEENMDPLLKVIEDAKRKLNTALNKND